MKKVLFTATVDSHILQFHLPFLKWFKENGYEVHVATNGDEKIPYCDVKHIVTFERNPFKFNNLKAIKQLKKICEREKYDIIHTHTPMGSVVTRLAAIKSRKKYNTRVIYTAHGLHFFKGAPLKNWLLFYPIEKFLSIYTDTLILINQEDYDLCKIKFKNCKDIQYIPGVGIDENKFNFELTKIEQKNLRKSLGINEDDFVMIYPAEISNRKRQYWLIDTIKDLLTEHGNIHLLLPGKDSLNGKCQKLVKELNLDSQIHFLGYRKDIPKLLKISDLSLSAACQEGLPVNIMEAMYVGLPIVASNCRGNRDLVRDHINGYLIALDDKDRYKESIEKIYNSKDSNRKFNDESQYIIKDYLLDKIISKIEKIYTKKTKVLHILASNKFSGAENVACTIINNLSDNYEMYYCSPFGTISKNLAEKNINYIGINKLSFFELKKAIKKINPDVIHAHDYKSSCFAALFHHKYSIVSHIHQNSTKMRTRNVNTIIYKVLSKYFKKIIYVSESSLNDYYYSKYVKSKSVVLYNVIDSDLIMNKSLEYNVKKNYDLMFLGRITEQKNPQKLIEIIRLLSIKNKNIKIAIIGEGNLTLEIKNLVSKYKLTNNVDFIGFVSNPFPYFLKSKLFIMTSVFEGTPMAALEAMCFGLPIISTPVDGLKKLVTNNYNGFLISENEEFANVILDLLSDDNNLKKMCLNSKRVFEDYNNLTKYCDVIDNIYKTIK